MLLYNVSGDFMILVIEDDMVLGESLSFFLNEEGFKTVVKTNGKDALEYLKSNNVEVVLLDVNLPDISGFDLIGKIKSIKDFSIIFLTANDLEVSIVRGLELGADDYITKPFKAKELVARIKNVIRRNNTSSNLIYIKNIIIDTARAKVTKNGNDIILTSLEYKILLLLVSNPNVIFTREKILASIWDVNEEYVNDNTLTVYIKRIREKIEDDPSNPKIIITVRNMGYKLGD